MAKSRTPTTALAQKIRLSVLLELTALKTPNSIKNMEPFKRFVDFSSRTASMDIIYASLLFGRNIPFLLNFLKESGAKGYENVTEEDIEKGARLTSQLFPEFIPKFREKLDDWLEEETSLRVKKYKNGELAERQARRQITKIVNRYNSFKQSARSVINDWLKNAYPDIYEKISKEDLQWLEKNASTEDYPLD